MPQTKTITTYTFDELNDSAKEVARDWFRESLDGEWSWKAIKDDAEMVGLNVCELGRVNDGSFVVNAIDTADRITKEHGDMTETYKSAQDFLHAHALVDADLENNTIEDQQQELETEFLKSILEDYRIMYEKEVEYQASNEQVDDSIRTNAYTFTEDGKAV